VPFGHGHAPVSSNTFRPSILVERVTNIVLLFYLSSLILTVPRSTSISS
jgi:hypothetical protein